MNVDMLSSLGVSARSVYYYGDRGMEGPVLLWALIKLKDNARMTKDAIEDRMEQYANRMGMAGGLRVFVATGETKAEFERIEQLCEEYKWGLDYGNSSGATNKKAKVSSMEEVANDLAAAVMRIAAESRPSAEELETLRSENAELRTQVERLKTELQNVRAEKDDYAIQCFEMRYKCGQASGADGA